MIKYANGTKDIISTNSPTSNNSSNSGKSTGKKEHVSPVFGIASLITGIAGLFVAGLIFGPIAIILGVIGLGRKRKLRGLAIAGLILGIIALVIAAVVAIIEAMVNFVP
jgi:hypothetical protein